MAFGTTHFAATNATKTTTIGAGVPSVYYSKMFLPLLVNKLTLPLYAQKKPLPEGNGLTVEFFRYRNLAPSYTALTEGVNPDADKIYGQKIQATVAEYGRYAQITSLVKQGHIDTGLEGAVEVMSDQAANTMNGLLMREICSNGCYPLAADLSTTSTYSGTLTTVTSTTSMADTAAASNTNFGDANDDFNQSIMIMTSGPAKGEARTITDYATSGGVITLTNGFDMTPEVGDTFVVTTPDEITTADDLSYANIKKARTILKKYHYMPYKGNFALAVVGPDLASNLMDDSDWKNVNTYKDNVNWILDGEIGRLAGVRFLEHDTPFNFPIETRGTAGTAGGPGNNGGNQADSGTVSCVPVFGRNAFGVTTFSKKGGQAMKPPIIHKKPGSGDTSNPLNRYDTIGWEIEIAHKSIYALHCVGIWCAAA